MQGWIALFTTACIFLHLGLRFSSFSQFDNYPLFAALLFGGAPLVWELIKKLWARNFGSDLLAGISIVTSVILEQYLAGALVVLMLSGGEFLERYAIRTASKVLEALAKRAPTIAHRKSKELFVDIPVAEIAIGDTIQIFPHEICPVDGVVLEGHGVMDEAYLTGEPFLISKAPGSNVISGSINGDASLTISATKLASDSRYAKIMQVMAETEQKRPRMRRLADQLGAWYTPLAIAIALVAWFVSTDPVRFLAVLVIATPCPLLIAIPVAIIGSISLSARRGILIKNPVVLEQLDQCKTMILDKTGTLTLGKPELTDQVIYNQETAQSVLQLVASVEQYSKHPLASAILQKAADQKIALLSPKEINEPKGKGLKGIVNGREVLITSRKMSGQAERLPQGMGLECVILIDGKLAAYYRFRDEPRLESERFIHHLPKKHGITKTMIVSGDRLEEVKYLGDQLGIKDIYASQSPEEKVAIVAEENRRHKTIFLGDGINDAPALVAANVGIAFGQNSDITAEAAGAVVMESSLERVDEFFHICLRMRRIALQSALAGMGLSLIGMGVAAFGYLPPVAGAITQEVIDVLAIVNSLRTAWMPRTLTDMYKKP